MFFSEKKIYRQIWNKKKDLKNVKYKKSDHAVFHEKYMVKFYEILQIFSFLLISCVQTIGGLYECKDISINFPFIEKPF